MQAFVLQINNHSDAVTSVDGGGDPLVMLGGTGLAIVALTLIGRVVTSRL